MSPVDFHRFEPPNEVLKPQKTVHRINMAPEALMGDDVAGC